MKGSIQQHILKRGGRFFLTAFFCASLSIFAQDISIDQYLKDCSVQGSITIYDLHNDKWSYSDEQDAKLQTLPASTFKIFNSLVALETKAVKDENQVLKWDGVDRGNKNWNADTDLKSAFKNSTLWFYQEIARDVGLKKYRKFIDKCNFGNKTVSDQVDMFWLDGSLAISPIEQINFLVSLYEDKLPFSKKNIQKVKDIMVYETTSEYTIRAKTGWGFKDDLNIGWWVGYLETKTNVYFFATRLTLPTSANDDSFGNCRKTITYNVFTKLGLIY